MANLYDQFDAQSEVKDLATSFGVGSNQLLKMAGDVYGLASGNMDNAVSRQGQENIDYLQRGKSQKLIQSETRRKAAVDMEEGTLNQALAYVRETFTDPRLFLSTTAEAAPSMVGAGGIGAGARVATGKVLAKMGAEKAAETATKVGVGTAVAAGAGMQGTSVGADQYKEIVELLSNMPEDQALKVPQIVQLVVEKGATLEEAKTALALDLARSTGALAALASAATQMLPGGRTIEKALVGGAGKKIAGAALTRAGVGAIGEGVQEALEEGSGAGVKNLLARAVDPERKITEGMGEAMGAGFAGAGPIGAAAGAASRPSRPVLASETTAGMSSEPLASDATTSEPRTSTTDTPDLSLEGAGEMNTREVGSVLSARESAARGFTPDPSDIATAENVRRPQIEVSEEAAKAANAPIQEALDEWRTQNPDVGVNISVINDPNMRNTRNYGIRGYFDPNTGEVVINSAFTKPFEVESVVNHEWSHHTLSSEEGRAALVEFATRDIPKEELDALAKRYPNADNLTLVEEWIARSQETSPGTFARIIAKIREWLNGKLGINMTNEEAARVMLRTLRERGAPVAEGSGEMRQTTTDQPLASDETTGAASRASGIMASPSVTDIDYPRAKQNLTSSAQARFRSQVKDYAPDAVIYNAVGDWKDGAENSVAAIFDTAMPAADLEQLAAKAGLAGDQKAVLWWTTDPNGADAIHRVTWPKNVTMDQARQAMIDAGLENRTLIETPDGVQGFVFDQGQQNLNKISNLHENSTEPSINTQPATGDFLGSWNTRVEGKRAYRAVLGRAEETETRDRGGQSDQRTGGEPEARYSVTDEPVPESSGAGSGRGGVLSSPSRMDSGTSSKTSSRQPNENVRKIADDYNAQSGQNPIEHGHYVSVDESLAQRIAKAYDALPEVDRSPETIQAYEALAKEVGDQWDFAVNNLGVTFEPWTKEGQPYANSREMVKDVRDNNHIYFFQGGDPHPFLGEVDPKTGFTANDKLRAVHDLFGHAAEDYQFGPRGEENAWIKHSQMFSPEAQRALSSETRGQNSWVNFGDQNYDENGVNKNIPAKDRPFAAQKTALLPEELTDWRSALGQSEPERSILASEKPKEVIRYSLTPEQIGAVDNRRINELDIEDLVSKGILTDRHGKLLSELRDASGGDASIEVVSPEDLPPRAAAVYDPNTNTIRVSNAAKPNLGRVLMHEYIHALTFMGLKYADERMTSSGDIISATPRPGVDIRDLREASRQMDGLFSTAEKAANDLGEKFYGLTNRMEFVAEAFSSKKFQDFLSSIPSTKGGKQSLFDQFITIVKKILGTESDSLLTDVITATDPFVGAKKTKTGTLMISEDSPALPDEPSEPERSSVLAKQPIRESVTEEPVGPTKKQTESPEFKKWFEVSKVVNEDGTPKVMFHSTTAGDVLTAFKRNPKDVGFHFGTAGQAEDRFNLKLEKDPYGPNLRGVSHATIPVFLRINRPLRMQDLGNWSGDNIFYALKNDPEFKGKLFQDSTSAEARDAIKAAGYDGIVYANTGESEGASVYRKARDEAWADYQSSDWYRAQQAKRKPSDRFPSEEMNALPEYQAYQKASEAERAFRESNPQDSYIAFDPNQVKSATGNTGAFDPKKKDIRYSVTEEPVGQDKKQTESTQFKNWFGDWQDPKAFTSRAKGPVSQVFKDGKPLVVYHATTKDFDSFESGRPTFDDMGFFGNVETNRHAIFFSDSPEQAGSYVMDSKGRADTGARTIPAYLDMKSPLYLDRNTNLDDLAEETGVNYNWLQNRRSWWELLDGEDGKMFVEGLKKAGYDGVVFEEDPIRPGVEVGTTYAVFEPSQVKSATGNRGTFDPTNTDIRYSVTEDPVDVADLPKNLRGDSEGFIPTYITKQNALPTVVVGKNKTVEIPVIDFSQYADKVFKAKGTSEFNGKNITLAEAHVPVIQKYYAGLSPETYREKDVRAAADMVANDMSNNLLFLHDLALDTFGPEVVKRMSKWYDGANVIAKKFADEYGVSIEQSAAILATLSPQKHWFANVSLAENVMDVMRNHQDTVFDAAVEKAARASIKNSDGTTSSKRVLYEYIRAISGKKLSDLNSLEEKTVFTRFLSQSIHPKLAYVVTPEGQLTPGSSVAIAWSGIPTASNAINSFLDGSVNNLTMALGGGHKVRDFYGNIVDPMSPFFYTSDTHNVAASLLLPVGGTNFEVYHNFGGNPGVGKGPKLPVIGTTVTGLQGTYPLYLEAGRRAAEQRNLLPRQMQSITWEMIRIMFTDDMKTPAFMDSVKRVHDQVRGGGLDIDSARQNIIELSGGRDAIKARPPEWLNK